MHDPGMSALQFQKMLKINRYEVAFNMLHKLRAAMVRPKRDRIGGKWPVEVDETYVGGATQGEGSGKASQNSCGRDRRGPRPRKEALAQIQICLRVNAQSIVEDTDGVL